ADELVGPEVDAMVLGLDHVFPGGAGEVAEHRAVARPDPAEVVGADTPAGALAILHDDERLPCDMLGDVLAEQPALDIARAAGREVDQQREALALVERLLRGGMCDERDAEPNDGCAQTG